MVSIAGAAKEELASKAGIRSVTIAKMNHHLEKSDRQKLKEKITHVAKTVISQFKGWKEWRREKMPSITEKSAFILDESGMIDSKSLHPIIEEVKKKGGTIIMVGDNEQLSPIGPGSPFLHITRNGATCHLSENFRQRNSPEDAQAAAHVRAGEIEKALDNYAQRGRLTVARNRSESVTQLVNEWVNDGGVKEPQKAFVLTQTRAEAKEINKRCQDARLLAGELSFESAVIRNQSYYAGDRVMFHKKIVSKGVENGYQGRITSIDSIKRTVTIRMDGKPSKEKRKMGHKQTVTIAIKDLSNNHISLGYAATTHKLQGQSVERAYCLLGGGMTNKEMTYVQLTRGEMLTKLFIDKHHAGEKLADIAEAMKQSGKKELAHDQGIEQRLRIKKNDGAKT
jgi:ATP-dependent exoDNAse (exonuclease V) alpha subunit